jgi:uncharacterized protein HemX
MTNAEMIVAAGGATDGTLALALALVVVVSAAAVGYFLLQIKAR